MSWFPPSFTLKWGAYSKPDEDDEAKLVDMTIKAKAAGIISTLTAVEKVARVFGIENPHEYCEALEAVPDTDPNMSAPPAPESSASELPSPDDESEKPNEEM